MKRGSPLTLGRKYRKLTLDEESVWRYRLLAAHTGLTAGDAVDLALREALSSRGLPEEPNDFANDPQRTTPVEPAPAAAPDE